MMERTEGFYRSSAIARGLRIEIDTEATVADSEGDYRMMQQMVGLVNQSSAMTASRQAKILSDEANASWGYR